MPFGYEIEINQRQSALNKVERILNAFARQGIFLCEFAIVAILQIYLGLEIRDMSRMLRRLRTPHKSKFVSYGLSGTNNPRKTIRETKNVETQQEKLGFMAGAPVPGCHCTRRSEADDSVATETLTGHNLNWLVRDCKRGTSLHGLNLELA